MKIAVLEPYIKGAGGAQRVIAEYCNYLKCKGHSIEIFTQKYDTEDCYKEFKNLKINTIRPKSKIFSPFAFLFHKYERFDIVIANDFPSNFASIFNKNVIWICYSPRRYFYDLKDYYYKNASRKGKIALVLKNILFKKIDVLSAKRSQMILPISKTVQERVNQHYGKSGKIFYPGLYTKKYKSGKFEGYILSVSRLVGPKRVDYIIKAMGYVKNKKITLYVVGDGADREKIKALSSRYKNVKFLGETSDEKLKKLYANCLCVVYIPINEDWGLIPLEAAASGKPTIGANEGGLRETIVNGKTGFLLNHVTPEKIAEKIDYLAENKNLARKMGDAAKQNVKKFDWNLLLPTFEKLISLK
jgi:glycosyltransferase involved in cell wall biosynthesis